MGEGDSRQFAFDEFVLDCASGELRRSGTVVDLRPKLHDLLRYLVERPARLASKEEILTAVWGDVHVSDGSLNRTVAELRQVLGDDPRRPRLIETVARRGYRFIAPVVERSVSSSEVSSAYVLLLSDRTVPLRLGETILGRTPECDVQIIRPSVSRRHARITVTPAGASIEDLDSTNGTFVREQRISAPAAIEDGDDILLGKERLRLLSDRAVRARTEPAL